MHKLVAALFSIALSTSCTSEARVLTNTEQLKTALQGARGGEVIELAPGLYGDFSIKKNQVPSYAAIVTVQAADPRNPPVFMKPVVLRGANNLVFRGVHWQLSDASISHQPLVRLHGGRSIVFENNLFQGIRSAQRHAGYGILADDVEGLRISNSRFLKLDRAIVASRVKGFDADRNDIVDIGHDGFSLADISGRIVANLIEDFHPREGYHPDGIQFHSNRQRAAHDVLIENNLIIGAPDRRIQGIFMRAGYATDPSQRYRNIRIRGNIVAGAMWHGIRVGQADAVDISGNKVLHLPGEDRVTARISTKDSTGRAENNEAVELLFEPSIAQAGNKRIPPSTPDEVQALRREWLGRFRGGSRAR